MAPMIAAFSLGTERRSRRGKRGQCTDAKLPAVDLLVGLRRPRSDVLPSETAHSPVSRRRIHRAVELDDGKDANGAGVGRGNVNNAGIGGDAPLRPARLPRAVFPRSQPWAL